MKEDGPGPGRSWRSYVGEALGNKQTIALNLEPLTELEKVKVRISQLTNDKVGIIMCALEIGVKFF
jgi:hypothetical protein